MKDRIRVIDGWRAIAAIGVLYGHVLATLKTPQFSVAGIDVIKVLNLWGYGVHLFFVISGFCFFLVMAKEQGYSLSFAFGFWKKRWIRIAPAFYVSCLVYACLKFSHIDLYAVKAVLANFLFVQPYIEGAEINAIYWSLSAEWIFYICLPFVFLLINKVSHYFIFSLIILIGLAFNFLHYKAGFYPGDSWQYTFLANFEHFGWGLLIGYIYKNNLYLKVKLINHKLGFVAGLGIAYIGKIFFTAAFVAGAGSFGFFFQSIGPLIMTFGFAWLILNSLANPFIFKLIGNKFFVFIGRISYSFYVWHTLILSTVYLIFNKYYPATASGVLLLLISVLIILIPFSYLSYRLLEAFYFKKRKQ